MQWRLYESCKLYNFLLITIPSSCNEEFNEGFGASSGMSEGITMQEQLSGTTPAAKVEGKGVVIRIKTSVKYQGKIFSG
jgi:hypothetical protein